jgi:Ser/Thr protein kinase RdoA (MazF antagonist)
LVGGYRSVTRLEEDELDVLLDMIEMRLLMTPIIERIRAAEGVAAQGYLAEFGGRSFPLLAELQGNRDALGNLIRRA